VSMGMLFSSTNMGSSERSKFFAPAEPLMIT